MRALVQIREKAKEMRRKGLSYRDILELLKVSKSSLSLWLRDLPLTPEERRSLRHRKDANISRGRIKAASALSRRRLEREKIVFEEAKINFKVYARDPLFPIGIALYWAEGGKRSNQFYFVNSDSEMISLMARWIQKYIEPDKSRWQVRLYTHRPFAHENQEQYWAILLGIEVENMKKTVYKPSGKLVKKRPNYLGCIRIDTGGKRALLKAKFWQKLLIEYCTKEK